MAAAPTSVVPGAVLLGKYRVDRIIGQGGMGVVVAATHIGLDEKVALKILRSDTVDAEEARTRIIREAQAAVKLKSEYVSRVSDVGFMEDGSPYMVMEYLEGSDLAQMVDTNGKIDAGLAVDFILQACEGLTEAHGLGIVHRDIKPSNIFVTWRADGSPLVKILDFGISRAQRPGDELSLTKTASVLGTPAYMSPEQMRSSRRVDHRTDLWSVGVVLYELVEGRWPFSAESFTEMCAKVAADEPDPMTCGPALRDVVMRCLEKDPAKRYETASELAVALAPMARDTREAQMRVERIARIAARGRLAMTPAVQAPAAGVPNAPMANISSAPIPVPIPTGKPAQSQPIVTSVPVSVNVPGDEPTAVEPPKILVQTGQPETLNALMTDRDIPAQGGRSRALVIGLSAVLVVGAAIAAFAVVGGKKSTTTTTTPENVVAPSIDAEAAAVAPPIDIDAAIVVAVDAAVTQALTVVDAAPPIDAAPALVVTPDAAVTQTVKTRDPKDGKSGKTGKTGQNGTKSPTNPTGVGSGSAYDNRK